MDDLQALFQALGTRAPRRKVTGISHDTRRLRPGNIYVALKGQRFDGHDLVDEALRRGAVAVVGERPLKLPVPYARVGNARKALAKLAAHFYDLPATRLKVIGVTGTDGKTTTSHLIHHLLNQNGRPTGLIGSVGYAFGHRWRFPEGHFTTPEAPALQAALAEMLGEGLRAVVLETSSHALAQHRVDEVDYDLAVWTHLSPEHLDFHKDIEDYFKAKASLVERARFAVLNLACPYARRLRSHPHLSYGPGGDFTASRVREDATGLRFMLQAPGFSGQVSLPMIGAYNVENALAALAAAFQFGIDLAGAVRALASFPGVPGRMQIVTRRPVRGVVDFAHTPRALAKALETLKKTTQGRLIVVVGAAGERDPGKRKPLGKVAATLADVAVFTEEDSRSEPVEVILKALTAGAREGRAEVHIEPDRRRAIRLASRLARPGDTILLAGKGHERTLERANEVLAWDEVAELKAALGLN